MTDTRRLGTASLATERNHFDRIAEASLASDADLSMAYCLDRYAQPPRRPLYAQEAFFATVGDVKGRRVLDYCCGEGEVTVLLAMLGAEVCAFDLSPKAVEVTERRAAVNKVEHLVTTATCAAGQDQFGEGTFDLVVGAGVLHHLFPLGPVGEHVRGKLKPGGRAVFREPLADSALYRALRRLAPPCPIATPDERPLRRSDIAEFGQSFQGVELEHFALLARLLTKERPGGTLLRRIDQFCLRALPLLRRYAGIVIIDATT